MGRLIYADELKKDVLEHNRGAAFAIDFIEQIDAQPTVDAVEVVRCKDCKHYWKNINTEGYDGKCVSVDDDDFCSKGAKMDGGDK